MIPLSKFKILCLNESFRNVQLMVTSTIMEPSIEIAPKRRYMRYYHYIFRCFDMKLTKKTTYPSYPATLPNDIVLRSDNGQILYCLHNFDCESTIKVIKKCYKDAITFGDAPLHGQQLLRPLYYKVNESKIPATLRMGIT